MPPTVSESRVLHLVDSFASEMERHIKTLVKTPSSNPPGDTREIAGVLKDILNVVGIRNYELAADKRKPIILSHGIGDGDVNPKFLLSSHIDTVESNTGSVNGWKYPPLAAKKIGGAIYGRGTVDSKACVAAMIAAARALTECSSSLHGTVVLNFSSDWEEGGGKGAGYLLEKGRILPNYAILGEATDNKIAVANKSVFWMKIKTIGRTGVGGAPWEALNAIEKMNDVISAIRDKIGSRIKKQKSRLPFLPGPSICIGIIKGGIKPSRPADFCEIIVDRRLLPEENLEEGIEELKEILDDLEEKNHSFKAESEIIFQQPAFKVSPRERIVRETVGACRDLKTDTTLVGYLHEGEAWQFTSANIPAVVLGPGDPRLAHMDNEHVLISDALVASKIYALTALRCLS